MKKIFLPLFFVLITQFTFGQSKLQTKYDRATFTVIPAMLSINDTLAKDTTATWKTLPYSSFLLSEVEQKFIQADFKTGEKFYYNHTTIPENNPIQVSKSDTAAFENLFGKRVFSESYNRDQFKYYNPPKYKNIPKFSLTKDSYAEWLQNKLENSSIPGEMMILWTNENVLISRSEDNIDHRDSIRGANANNFNYYKKLLNKNYIVVQSIVKTQKLVVDPEILKAEKEARELALKKRSFLDKIGDFFKKQKAKKLKKQKLKKDKEEGYFENPYKIDSNKYAPNRLIPETSTFLKSYVYRVVLTPELMGDLSSYPAVQPKTAKLEFVCSINDTPETLLKSNRLKSLASKDSNNDEGFVSRFKTMFKNFSTNKSDTTFSNRYIDGMKSVETQIALGEFYCASQILNQLKTYTNYEKDVIDSLQNICEIELAKSPEINQRSFNSASIEQQNKPEDYFYQKRCENFENFNSNTDFISSQNSFDKLVGILESKINDFKVLTSAEKVVKNKIEANIDAKQGIYLGQQYKIVERSVNKKGERYDNRIGTARIIKVSKNLYETDSIITPTKLAQVDGQKIGQNALMIQDDVKGISINGGYGYRYKDNALIFGVDFLNKKLAKYPGLSFGANVVSNLNIAPGYSYRPLFFNLTAAKATYLSRIVDVRPFAEFGYGGDFGNEEGERPEKRSAVLTLGVGLPLNLYNQKTSQKFKIMPEFSVSTQRLSAQACLIAKIEF